MDPDLTRRVTDAAAEAAATGDRDTLCIALATVRAVIATLKEREAELELELAELLPWKQVVDLPGVGRFTKHRGGNRTRWSPDLADKVAAMSRDERMVDWETGEMVEDETSACVRVLSECARLEWRLTPLRQRGIDPDEYCTVTRGPVSIEIVPLAPNPKETP